MSSYYQNYVWKKGIPYGIGKVDALAEVAYKIPMDPYRKRISVEEWRKGKFARVIYDSGLMDFRHLQPAEQYAWQKVLIHESSDNATSEIRNQDDRTILIETYLFEKGFCRSCISISAHGVPISELHHFYTFLSDSFNGVVLYDSIKCPVMFKRYASDDLNGEFTELIEEEWDMSKPLPDVVAYAKN